MKLKKELHTNTKDFPQILLWIRTCCQELVATKQEKKDLELALEEAVANVIEYSYPNQTGSLHLIWESSLSGCSVLLIDEGVPFNPTQHSFTPPSLSSGKKGGLGIFLIHQLVNEVIYARKEEKNHLTLIKHFSQMPSK